MTQTQQKRMCRYCRQWRDVSELVPSVVRWQPGWKCKDNCNATIELRRKQKEAKDGSSNGK